MTYCQMTDVDYENKKSPHMENIHSFGKGNNLEKN
jgi:hypothetical protein